MATPSNKPSVLTWYLATLNVAILAGLLLCGHLFVSALKLARLQSAFAVAAQQNTISSEIVASGAYDALFDRTDHAVRQATSMLAAIRAGKYAEAEQMSRNAPAATPRLGRELQKNIKELVTLGEQKSRREAELRGEEEREFSYVREFLEARRQFREISQLEPKEVTENLGDSAIRSEFIDREVRFYQGGVLIGLPTVDEIPDNVVSWEELRKLLVLRNPQVDQRRLGINMSGALDDLKLQLQPFQQKFAENAKRIDEKMAQLEELEGGEKRVQNRTLEFAQSNLSELARPKVPQLTAQVYEEVSQLITSYTGVKFPELHPRNKS